MSYTTSDIMLLASAAFDLGWIVRASTGHADKVIQCYVSGRLAAWRRPVEGLVEFTLANLTDDDLVFLLAVDDGEESTNYWPQAYSAGSQSGNRIAVQTPQWIGRYEPGYLWKVYLGGLGEASADTLVHKQEFYPGGRFSGGWGKGFGHGGWGWSGSDCAGWGNTWGRGEWGYDCHMLTWTSGPLPRGTYPVRATVEDEHRNESAAQDMLVTVTTYPRPATNLTVDSYDKNTDTLVLSFTGSEDVNP